MQTTENLFTFLGRASPGHHWAIPMDFLVTYVKVGVHISAVLVHICLMLKVCVMCVW